VNDVQRIDPGDMLVSTLRERNALIVWVFGGDRPQLSVLCSRSERASLESWNPWDTVHTVPSDDEVML